MKGTVHVAYTDSVDKVVSTFYPCSIFEYKGVTYEPARVLHVIKRFYIPQCGGC